MIVEFLAQARGELHDAVSYPEGELSGLGLRFWDEVDQHITWITGNAEVARLPPWWLPMSESQDFPVLHFLHCSRFDDLRIGRCSVAHSHSHSARNALGYQPGYWKYLLPKAPGKSGKFPNLRVPAVPYKSMFYKGIIK
jgi:hypothetical protein